MVYAWHAATIEHIIEIACKAHVIRVPVSCRVLECKEYDSLDAESLLLHGKRIQNKNVTLDIMADLKMRQHFIAPEDFESFDERKGDPEQMEDDELPPTLRK